MTTAQENNETGATPTETQPKRTRTTKLKAVTAEESKTTENATATTDEAKAAEVNGSGDDSLASDTSKTENGGLEPSGDASANTGDTDADTPPAEENKTTAEGEVQASLNNADAHKLSEATEKTTLNEAGTSQDALTAFQLRVKNRGKRAICHVSKATIPEGETVVITYQSIGQKDLARGNFEQINALSFGGKRYIVEG